MKKKLLLFILLCMTAFTLTGCLMDTEIDSIMAYLDETGCIPDNWTYVKTLEGLGPNLGDESNLPEMDASYKLFTDGTDYYYIKIKKYDADGEPAYRITINNASYNAEGEYLTFVQDDDYIDDFSIMKYEFGLLHVYDFGYYRIENDTQE